MQVIDFLNVKLKDRNYMQKYFLALLLSVGLLSSTSLLQGEIVQSDKIETVLDYVKDDTLVLMNITSNLYEPINTCSEHQWRLFFSSRVNELITDKTVASKINNKVRTDLVTKIPKKNVDEITPELVSKLQDQKIPVLAITKKGMSNFYADNFGLITSKHLLSLGIDLEKTLSYLNISSYRNDENHSFSYGIIFTNDKPEGAAILSFLEKNGYKPSHIAMVDNSQKDLDDAEKALANSGITFSGIRYSRCDAQKASFDPILGIIEFVAFVKEDRIMLDDEAIKIKQRNSDTNYKAILDDLILKMAQR